jgi:hypothetical protein
VSSYNRTLSALRRAESFDDAHGYYQGLRHLAETDVERDFAARALDVTLTRLHEAGAPPPTILFHPPKYA